MASVAAQLRDLRLKVEALQVEVAGRQNISSMVVWDEQNQSSVNSKTSQIQEIFSGLVVHLTPELSAQVGTEQWSKEEPLGVSKIELDEIRDRLLNDLSQ